MSQLPKPFARFWICVCFILAFSTGLKADVFKPADTAALAAVVEQFSTDVRDTNVPGVLKVMPPKIWNYVKEKSKATDVQITAAISAAMKKSQEKIKIVGFSLNVAEATSHVLSDGGSYMLVPTETRMKTNAGELYVVRTQTLALLEDQKWYLVRINDVQQRKILGAVYPAFQTVQFPEEQTEIVKE
jgi:hypothetical protein